MKQAMRLDVEALVAVGVIAMIWIDPVIPRSFDAACQEYLLQPCLNHEAGLTSRGLRLISYLGKRSSVTAVRQNNP